MNIDRLDDTDEIEPVSNALLNSSKINRGVISPLLLCLIEQRRNLAARLLVSVSCILLVPLLYEVHLYRWAGIVALSIALITVLISIQFMRVSRSYYTVRGLEPVLKLAFTAR